MAWRRPAKGDEPGRQRLPSLHSGGRLEEGLIGLHSIGDVHRAEPIEVEALDARHGIEDGLDLEPTKSLQKPPGPIGAFAACRMRLNSIICRGTVMLQSMYLYTIGLLPTETQYSRMYM